MHACVCVRIYNVWVCVCVCVCERGREREITCGMIVIRERKSCNPISAMFTPSMMIAPSIASMIRNKESDREDFPAPVRPTMPTYEQV